MSGWIVLVSFMTLMFYSILSSTAFFIYKRLASPSLSHDLHISPISEEEPSLFLNSGVSTSSDHSFLSLQMESKCVVYHLAYSSAGLGNYLRSVLSTYAIALMKNCSYRSRIGESLLIVVIENVYTSSFLLLLPNLLVTRLWLLLSYIL